MYLEFVKDLFKANEHICVVCGEERAEGTLLKINAQLIAIKTKQGIVIKKDTDISDIFSISTVDEYIGSNVDGDVNKSSCFVKPHIDPNIMDSHDDESRQIEYAEKKNDNCNENLSSESAPTLQLNDMELSESIIYEVPKPQIKVVGHIDLSAIKDKKWAKAKKKSMQTTHDNNDNKWNSCRNIRNEEKSAIAERSINALIQKGETQNALSLIELHLKSPSCEGKFRSSLLLKKAQAYSTLSEYENAKTSYEALIHYNESIKSPSNNLSHLYTELARLQNLTGEGKNIVRKSLSKAIEYNPRNSYAASFIEQLSLDNTEDDKLKIDLEETTTISPMISIDIKEHLFTHDKIIENEGVPTPSIAKSIYEEAKETKGVDLSERYPIYLEAAKAYSMLPIGSYDTQEYLESVAYYAILKGNSLFLKFKKAIDNDISDIEALLRIKDSACSYYVESLNLLSNIKGEHLLTILANYLKMNIAVVCVKHGTPPAISGNFNKVFFSCISSPDAEMNLVAWSTIITVGTASPNVWNQLTNIKGGTGGLYSIMASPQKRQGIYSILNKININPIQTDLMPGEFLKKSFVNRKSRNTKFREILSNVLRESLNIRLLAPLDVVWQNIPKYIDLLSDTDKESYKVGSMILHNLLPYSTRQSQIERSNLLIQAQGDLEEQIEFINQNTTYYGRTFFSPLYVGKFRK